MIKKLDSFYWSSDFVNHSLDCRPNWTLLSLITIIITIIIPVIIIKIIIMFNEIHYAVK